MITRNDPPNTGGSSSQKEASKAKLKSYQQVEIAFEIEQVLPLLSDSYMKVYRRLHFYSCRRNEVRDI